MRNVTSIIISILLSASVVTAGDISTKAQPLQGLNAYRVLIEDIRALASNAGLSKDTLQKYIEYNLRKNGLTVLPLTASPLTPYIYCNINTSANIKNRDGFGYNVELSVSAPATIKANGKFAAVIIWDNSATGVSNSEDFKNQATESIDLLLMYFLNDYLEANPKGSAKK